MKARRRKMKGGEKQEGRKENKGITSMDFWDYFLFMGVAS